MVDYHERARMKGAKPMRRVRERARVESEKAAYVGCTAASYDRTWLGKQTTTAMKVLCISLEPFSLKRFNN